MENKYNEDHANELIALYPDIAEELIRRTYTSRLIGANPDLVFCGGGSTSLKLGQKNILGEDQEILCVKGRGVDLATIEPEDFVGLELTVLRKFRKLEKIDVTELDNQLQIYKLQPSPFNPSVDALLHAFLPHRYIEHTYADSILVLASQPDGLDIVQEALGPMVAVLPFTTPGLSLAKAAAAVYSQRPDIEAMVILNYGMVTFGEDAQTSYTKIINAVSCADAFINKRAKDHRQIFLGKNLPPSEESKSAAAIMAQSIRGVCAHDKGGGQRYRFRVEFRDPPDLIDPCPLHDARMLYESGVLTPEHAAHTKNRYIYLNSQQSRSKDLVAILDRKIIRFADHYHRFFQEHAKTNGLECDEPDCYPRVFLVQGLGLFTLGVTHREAILAADIAEHTIRAKIKASAIGAYSPIADDHVFDSEYCELQRITKLQEPRLLLAGQIALITGGGGAIGCGIADRLLAAGAAVVLSDIDETRLKKVSNVLKNRYPTGEIEIISFDVSDYPAVTAAYDEISRRIGGIDIVVPNAGIAHVARLEDLDLHKFSQVIDVNFKGTLNTIKAAIPIFRRQGSGGNIVVISTKNVFDPGAAFGAYSATKAGAHQIAKIAALELAPLKVRVNMINPDAVFGDENISSKLWDLIGPDRMKARGLDYEGLRNFYRDRNLLKARVLAEHVGNAVVFFASNQTPTTGASLPVDGGLATAFPR